MSDRDDVELALVRQHDAMDDFSHLRGEWEAVQAADEALCAAVEARAFRSLGAGTPEAVAALRELARTAIQQRLAFLDPAYTTEQWSFAADATYSASQRFSAVATLSEVTPITRLIPTRDRAQATRYASNAAYEVIKRCANEWSAIEEDGNEQWVIALYSPRLHPLWSGPWYVREVAE